MSEELKNLIQEFRPQFGNKNHIVIKEKLEKLSSKEKRYNRGMKNERDMKKLFDEIEKSERYVKGLLEKKRQGKIV